MIAISDRMVDEYICTTMGLAERLWLVQFEAILCEFPN
jgi:hypothetical protein